MKVFITNEPNLAQNLKPKYFFSKDFLLPEEKYSFPTGYMLAGHIEEGENVKVVVCHQMDKPIGVYNEFENEIKNIAKEKHLKLTIEHVYFNSMKGDEFRNNSIMDGFKETIKFITSGNHVFMDLSYCQNIYANVLFMATDCALLTTENIDVDIYGSALYAKKDGTIVMEIVSLESLLMMAKLSAKMPMGSRKQIDRLLNFEVPSFFDENRDEDEEDDEDNDQD